MACNETNCINSTCALCFHCERSFCLHHIIIHHDTLLGRHLSFYDILQQLYQKLHTMSIERCYQQVFEQLSSEKLYSSDAIFQLRSIREELIEQLNRFKQKQFHQLQRISLRLYATKKILTNDEENDMRIKLEQIQESINSLVYGIHMEISTVTRSVQYRKIFHHKTQTSMCDSHMDLLLPKSSSWTNGCTENYWTEKNELDERLSLF